MRTLNYTILALFSAVVLSCIQAQPSKDMILNHLKKLAVKSGSDSVLVRKNGKKILEYSSGKVEGPIESMSVTKSVVALIVGRAVTLGFISSIDDYVWKYLPAWKETEHKTITIRHLLSHTSGLYTENTTENIYKADDFVAYAMNSKLVAEPGQSFRYNNNACNLLPAIVQSATGKYWDDFLQEEFFKDLLIRKKNWMWRKDRSGNPHGMSGFQVRAKDLIKFGEVVLNKGSWNGKQLIRPDFIQQMINPGQSLNDGCGLLWWLRADPAMDIMSYDASLVQSYEDAGLSSNYLEVLKAMIGKSYSRAEWKESLIQNLGSIQDLAKFFEFTESQGLMPALIQRSKERYHEANGYLGQYLVVVPKSNVVAVRQIHWESATENSNFNEFSQLVNKL